MTKSEIMQLAHKLAKAMVGDYQARLSLALRQAWAVSKEGGNDMPKQVQIDSADRMSNRQYHAHSKPCWWVRTNAGEFIEIPRTRGDDYLQLTVEVEDDVTELFIGCGPRNKHGIRETIKVA